MSYSMIGELVLEYSKCEIDSEMVKALRNLYTNLRNETLEYSNKLKDKEKSNFITQSISFEFYGKKREYMYFSNIIREIRCEFEYALSNYIGKNIHLEIINGIYRKSKATSLFVIKEAN